MVLAGQIFGIIAVITGIISYQVKTRQKLVFCQLITSVVFAIHYFLIGAYSGFAMNCVCSVRNLVYAKKDSKYFSSPVYPYVFAVIMGCMGALSWQGYASILVVVGLILNTIAMSFDDPQKIRASILVTSPMVLIYDIIVHSVGGAIYESVVIVSSLIGIIRMRRTDA